MTLKLFYTSLFFALSVLGLSQLQHAPVQPPLADDTSVEALLLALGETPAPHQADTTVAGASAEEGRKIVTTGIAIGPNGKRNGKQSNHFVCTSCHNIQREDPDLRYADPQARLEYANEKGLPFLQGSPLYGVVNRRSFYNGDYDKKYGDLVEPARNDLREAIQLCAVECSQGRLLENWELESVLAYLWTIDLKLGDLQLTADERQQLQQAAAGTADQAAAAKLLRSYYLDYSPATFVRPPDDRKLGTPGLTGDPANGKLIYDLSCLHCHEGGRYAFFELDSSPATFKYLEKHMGRYTRYSFYQVIRWGTSPVPGKRSYMPNYTAEKMNDQMLADLRAYIISAAE